MSKCIKINIPVPDFFEKYDCFACPFGILQTDDEGEDYYICPLEAEFSNCPLDIVEIQTSN